MESPVQLLRLTKPYGGDIWVIPGQIIYAELGRKDPAKIKEMKDPKKPAKEEDQFMTILHVAGKEGKIFVNEHPIEINRIIRTLSSKFEVTYIGK